MPNDIYLRLLLFARIDFARAPCGLFAVEVHLELRHRGGTGYLVLVDAWSIDCYIVLVSVQRSLVFRIELKIPIRPDSLHLEQFFDVLGQHLLILVKQGKASIMFHSRCIILGHSANYTDCPT